MYQPTKKTFYILIACIFSLIIISIAKNQTDEIEKPLPLETNTNIQKESVSTNDFNFVQNNTNNKTDSAIDVGGNLTDDFSKGLFAKYMSTNSGTELSAQDTENLVKQAVSSYKTINLGNALHYSFKDLKIEKSNEQNLRYFANTFATKEGECLAEVRTIAQTTQDPTKTGELYKKCAEEFVKIPITQEINQAYLNLINIYYLMGEKIVSLEDAKNDPLKTLVIMKDIGAIDDEKILTYVTISNLIKKSGIIFSEVEPGHIWTGNPQ